MARSPSHWEDSAPNESGKHVARQVPRAAWWILAFLTLFIAIGLGSLVLYT